MTSLGNTDILEKSNDFAKNAEEWGRRTSTFLVSMFVVVGVFAGGGWFLWKQRVKQQPLEEDESPCHYGMLVIIGFVLIVILASISRRRFCLKFPAQCTYTLK